MQAHSGIFDDVRNVCLSVLFGVYFQKRDGALIVFENTARRNGVPQAVIRLVLANLLQILWVDLRCHSIVSLLWAWATEVPTPYKNRDPQGPIRTTMKTPGHYGVAVTLLKFVLCVFAPPKRRGSEGTFRHPAFQWTAVDSPRLPGTHGGDFLVGDSLCSSQGSFQENLETAATRQTTECRNTFVVCNRLVLEVCFCRPQPPSWRQAPSPPWTVVGWRRHAANAANAGVNFLRQPSG